MTQGRTAPESPLEGSDERLARFRDVLSEKLETGVVSMLVRGAGDEVRDFRTFGRPPGTGFGGAACGSYPISHFCCSLVAHISALTPVDGVVRWLYFMTKQKKTVRKAEIEPLFLRLSSRFLLL